MKYIIALLIMAIIFCPVHTGEEAIEISPTVDGNNRFAMSIYRQISVRGGNIFFSPYSISLAFAMTYAGAKNSTREQIAKTMQFSLDQSLMDNSFKHLINTVDRYKDGGNIQLNTANSIFPSVDFHLCPDFQAILKEYYNSSVIPLQYSQTEHAAGVINSWVMSNTNNRIKDLVSPDGLSPTTLLVIANAIFFKAIWENEFDPDHTIDREFHISPENSVQTRMMHRRGEYRYFGPGNQDFAIPSMDFQAIELPYHDRELSMIIILPDTDYGIKQLEEKLDIELIKVIDRGMRTAEVDLFMPKWTLEYSITLNDILQNMGMIDPFSSTSADFTGMFQQTESPGPNMSISSVIHKAFIEVNEEGTEAAAATAIVFVTTSEKPHRREVIKFHADRPFIYYIKDNITNCILFIGRMSEPN